MALLLGSEPDPRTTPMDTAVQDTRYKTLKMQDLRPHAIGAPPEPRPHAIGAPPFARHRSATRSLASHAPAPLAILRRCTLHAAHILHRKTLERPAPEATRICRSCCPTWPIASAARRCPVHKAPADVLEAASYSVRSCTDRQSSTFKGFPNRVLFTLSAGQPLCSPLEVLSSFTQLVCIARSRIPAVAQSGKHLSTH